MTTAPTRKRARFAVVPAAAFAAVFFVLSCSEPSAANTTKDDLGRDVAVPSRVARVVALSPNLTEMIFAVGAGQKIVATDDFSNFPAAARALPKVGGLQPNIERIAALRPDLVIAGTEGNHPNLAPALAAAGIPLYVVSTDRLAQIAPAMQRLGTLLGGTRTDEAVRELNEGIARQRRTRAKPPRVMFAVWTDPLYVAGRNSFSDDLLQLTGAQNAVQVAGWPNYSLESLMAAPPDLILYSQGAVTPAHIAALRRRVPEVKAEIIGVDEDVFLRPGPRVAEAARQLNAILATRFGSSS
jgi:ABC-type Fe3+-hydroxamate transport system substrate-binding protein